MFVDTHAHLTDPKYDKDLGVVVERAQGAGVAHIICLAGDLSEARRVVKLKDEYPSIYGCVGLYPGEGQKNLHWREDLEAIEEIMRINDKIVGVGEIGLDIYWNERDERQEMEMFSEQLKMAVRLDKPVVIHNRQSHDLIKRAFSTLKTIPRGQFHCFTGDPQFLEWIMARGFYVGFDGNITYPSNGELRALVKLVPSARLLLETDSPYLPPQGKRGERNEPANVRMAAQIIAEQRGVTLLELAEQTTKNAKALFKL